MSLETRGLIRREPEGDLPRCSAGALSPLTPPSSCARTPGVAEAGQAALLPPPSEEAVLAALTVGALRVAQAAKAAVPVSRLPQELPVKDTLPGHPVAVTHWGEESRETSQTMPRDEGTSSNPTLRGKEQVQAVQTSPSHSANSELLPHTSAFVPMSVSISYPGATSAHTVLCTPTLGRNAPFHCSGWTNPSQAAAIHTRAWPGLFSILSRDLQHNQDIE